MNSFEFCKGCPAKKKPEVGQFSDANKSAKVGVRGTEGYYYLWGDYSDYTGATVQDGERTTSFYGGGGDISGSARKDPKVAEAFRNCSQIEAALQNTPDLISDEARAQRNISCAAIHSAFPELTPEALYRTLNNEL